MLDPHILPRRFQFIGENARERCADMLAHLRADHVDRHDPHIVDRVPLRRLIGCGGRRVVGLACRKEGKGNAGSCGGNQKAAAGEGWSVH